MAERELLKEPLAHWIELHDGGDVLGCRRRAAALQLYPGPARDVPDRELADQLCLVEAIPFTLGRQVGEPALGRIQFALRDYAGAADNLEKSETGMIADENWQVAYYLHATYGYLERTEALEKLHQKWQFPQFSLAAVRMDAFYRRDEDMEHYLEGLRRAGVSKYPYGFQPAEHVGERIAGAALKDLLYGRSFRAFGSVAWLPATFHFSKAGRATWQVRHDIKDASPATVEGDSICFEFPSITRGREACYQVFRNSGEDLFPRRGDYEYVMVGPELYYFSPAGG